MFVFSLFLHQPFREHSGAVFTFIFLFLFLPSLHFCFFPFNTFLSHPLLRPSLLSLGPVWVFVLLMLWLDLCSSFLLPLQVGFLFCFFLSLVLLSDYDQNTFSLLFWCFYNGAYYLWYMKTVSCNFRDTCSSVFSSQSPFFKTRLCFSFIVVSSFSSVFPFKIPCFIFFCFINPF